MRTRLLCSATLLSLIALVGCSSKTKLQSARVSGTITFNGKPIKGGTMGFHTADGMAYPATISPDGTYNATDIAEGDMVITVETESIKPDKKAPTGKEADRRMKAGMQQAPEGMAPAISASDLYLKIPAKYGSPKTSPLTVTLKSGRNVHNVELTD